MPPRTSEIRDDERRYRVPALREQDLALPPPAAPSFPSSFRRPRAGTLPSNVHLARDPDPPAPPQPVAQQVQRPTLRHSASVATSVPSGRLRSESLTLPNLITPFGPSVFSTNWSRQPSNGFSPLEEGSDLADHDEFDTTTLNYLGLADNRPMPAPATLSELRSQAQAAIAGSLAGPARLRANTVSNLPYRNRTAGPMLATRPEESEEYEEDYGQDAFEGIYSTSAQVIAKGYRPISHLAVPNTTGARPRATSVGNLEESVRLRRPDQFPDSDYGSVHTFGIGVKSPARGSPAGRFPSNGELMRSPQAPKNEGPAQLQTPSRSLWIGNLDPTMTSEALIHVFAPYGAIESLRLLPEKECGFVNFVDQNDAIRAKEDVLNRLGGLIGMANGQAVRIGFGKADSAPVAPAKGSNNVMSPTSPAVGGMGRSPGALSPTGGPASATTDLQSAPTRALWIGSIPSTTTPATILTVFSPFGPIESARVLTHKNCGFVNFERLDDAVRARKALNGRDVLGSDVGAIRIGFARVPVKNAQSGEVGDDLTSPGGIPYAMGGMHLGSPVGGPMSAPVAIQGVGDLSVGAAIHALRSIKGASAIPADQQVLGGAVENYRSNLLLSMIGAGANGANVATVSTTTPDGHPRVPSVTEQQMIMRELSGGAPDAEDEVQALAEFRPPTMYYTAIPAVSERPPSRRWDASKLRELRKRLDSGTMPTNEIDDVAADFLDGEIVDLASDWLGNTVVQKLFEKCSIMPRIAMLDRIAPHLGMIGIHKNGTWAAQKIIECVTTPEEVVVIAQNLRPYTPPLLLDQFGNYVVQCCLKFGPPASDFIFDAMADRMWEIAQGRFGARSMRACLENPLTTINQQRRIATAIILNSIPLATNPNGALLLTWLLDTSNFPSRFRLLAPRFTPHLSHLCTHKLASLTVLRIINQKVEPEASSQLLNALFTSPADHVLTDVLGDQVNGVAVVHKILSSTFLDPAEKDVYCGATKRVLTELKVAATQAYRRLIEELGLPVPTYQASAFGSISQASSPVHRKPGASPSTYGIPGMPLGYTSNDPALASMMASLQLQGGGPTAAQIAQHQQQQQLQVNPVYGQPGGSMSAASSGLSARLVRGTQPTSGMSNASFSPSDPFNPFGMRSPDLSPLASGGARLTGNSAMGGQRRLQNTSTPLSAQPQTSLAQAGAGLMNYGQQAYGIPPPTQTPIPPHLYQAYMLQMYQQQSQPNVGTFHP